MVKRFTLKAGSGNKRSIAANDLNVSEAQEQIAFMQWLERCYPLVFAVTHHSPNGENRETLTGVKLKRMGCKPGFPDLVTYLPAGGYHGLVVEMKRPDNSPSEDQEFWLRHFEHIGYCVAVAVGYDEVVNVYQRYINHRGAPYAP